MQPITNGEWLIENVKTAQPFDITHNLIMFSIDNLQPKSGTIEVHNLSLKVIGAGDLLSNQRVMLSLRLNTFFKSQKRVNLRH